MLLMAIALLLPQDQALPAVAPGLCRAAGDHIASVTDIVRGRLQDDERAEREGREHKYESGQRQRMMTILEGDARDARTVQRRYANTDATGDEREQIQAMNAKDIVGYLRLCAA